MQDEVPLKGLRERVQYQAQKRPTDNATCLLTEYSSHAGRILLKDCGRWRKSTAQASLGQCCIALD